MEEGDIRKLIESKEFQRMELKASFAEKEQIGETVSAFSNTDGGVIFVGVSDDGSILGMCVGKGKSEKLAGFIKQCTDPKVYPGIKEHLVLNETIVAISVKESVNKPVLFKGRGFERVGRSNQKMSRAEIEKLLSQSRRIPHWDERICEGATLEDIDAEKLKWFLERTKSERNSAIDSTIPTGDALERLGLTRDGQITNAAILLFGRDPQQFFLQAETRCARFKGMEPIEFIDMKVLRGSIIDQREDAVEFVKEHIKLHAKVVGTDRVETWEYPIEAIREAITNAVCHGDYEMPANIQVRIFDDRVEIWGCGSLPEPLTVDDLKGDHRSILRNPLIGRCFYLIRFVEQWGTGTNRIISACREHGLPEPLFEERPDGLIVTLRKITEEMVERLSEKEKAIISYLKDKGTISRRECAALLNSSPATAHRYLSLLKGEGIISRREKGKKTHYVLSLDV